MKLVIKAIVIFFIMISFSYSSVAIELEKLSNLLDQGKISNDQFEKAKDILLKIEDNNKKKVLINVDL